MKRKIMPPRRSMKPQYFHSCEHLAAASIPMHRYSNSVARLLSSRTFCHKNFILLCLSCLDWFCPRFPFATPHIPARSGPHRNQKRMSPDMMRFDYAIISGLYCWGTSPASGDLHMLSPRFLAGRRTIRLCPPMAVPADLFHFGFAAYRYC